VVGIYADTEFVGSGVRATVPYGGDHGG
jgi:hypothetical protein